MSYQEINPPITLHNFIDAYWQIHTKSSAKSNTTRILPDTCADIIINLGAPVKDPAGLTLMETEQAYLIGTMTTFSEVQTAAGARLLGIRFKPGGLYSLLGISMKGTENARLQLRRTELDWKKILGKRNDFMPDQWNQFFLSVKVHKHVSFQAILQSIYKNNGSITVAKLCKQHFITERQIERSFENNVGISVKEFICQVRLQYAMRLLKAKNSKRTILQTAIEAGYYDHAHLSNALKKATGYSPSDLRENVGFLQTSHESVN